MKISSHPKSNSDKYMTRIKNQFLLNRATQSVERKKEVKKASPFSFDGSRNTKPFGRIPLHSRLTIPTKQTRQSLIYKTTLFGENKRYFRQQNIIH